MQSQVRKTLCPILTLHLSKMSRSRSISLWQTIQALNFGKRGREDKQTKCQWSSETSWGDGWRRSDGTTDIHPPQRCYNAEHVINKQLQRENLSGVFNEASKNKYGNEIQITCTFIRALDSQLQATLIPSLWAAVFDCPASTLCTRR